MKVDELFLATLQELRDRACSTSPYDLLRASALLRQLLVDGNPLVDQANRSHRLRIEFETIDFTLTLPVSLARVHIHWLNLDASSAPRARTIRVDRAGLLSAPLLRHKGREFSVRELIKTAANVWGGVHSGRAKSEAEVGLTGLQDELEHSELTQTVRHILGQLSIGVVLPDAVAALRGIAAVVLRGLEPLDKTVRATGT